MKFIVLFVLIFLMFSAFQVNRNQNSISSTEDAFVTGDFIPKMNQPEKQKTGVKKTKLDSAILSALFFHK